MLFRSQQQSQQGGGFWESLKGLGSSLLSLDQPLSQRFGYKIGGEGLPSEAANIALEEATRPSNIALTLGGIFTGGLGDVAAAERVSASTAARIAARTIGSAVAARGAFEVTGAGLRQLGVENPYILGGAEFVAGLAGGVGAYKAIPRAGSWFEAANAGLADQKAAMEAAAPEALQIGRGAEEGRAPY